MTRRRSPSRTRSFRKVASRARRRASHRGEGDNSPATAGHRGDITRPRTRPRVGRTGAAGVRPPSRLSRARGHGGPSSYSVQSFALKSAQAPPISVVAPAKLGGGPGPLKIRAPEPIASAHRPSPSHAVPGGRLAREEPTGSVARAGPPRIASRRWAERTKRGTLRRARRLEGNHRRFSASPGPGTIVQPARLDDTLGWADSDASARRVPSSFPCSAPALRRSLKLARRCRPTVGTGNRAPRRVTQSPGGRPARPEPRTGGARPGDAGPPRFLEGSSPAPTCDRAQRQPRNGRFAFCTTFACLGRLYLYTG
jgi:hypothetical protein